MRKLIIFFLLCFTNYLFAQDCNITAGLQQIDKLNQKGAFKKAITLSKELTKCPTITREELTAIWVWQYRIYRNDFKSRSSRRAIAKVIDTLQKIKAPISTDIWLHRAEGYALRRKFDRYKKAIANVEKDTAHTPLSDLNRGRYYLLQHLSNRTGDELALLKALNYLEKEDNVPLYYMANTLRGLGNFSRSKGDFEKAISYYQRELTLCTDANYDTNHFQISICHYNLGGVYYEKLSYKIALDHFLKAHAVWKKKFKPRSTRMRSLNEAIGDMYFELDDHKNALLYFNKAVDNEKKINNDISEETVEKANDLLKKGDYQLAIDYYKEALRWREKTYGEKHLLTGACKNFVARAMASSGDLTGSLKAYQEAINILVEEMEDSSWYNNPTAEMKIHSRKYLLESLTAKASLLSKLYSRTKNIKDLKAVLETQEACILVLEGLKSNLSETSKEDWISNTISLVEKSIQSALALHKLSKDRIYLEKAFNFSERSKALILLQSLQNQEISSFANVPKEILNKEKDLKKRITEHTGRIQNEEKRCLQVRDKILTLNNEALLALEDEYSLLLKTIKQDYPDYYQLKHTPDIVGLKTIQSDLLNEDTALISFFSGNENLFVFCITNSNITIRTIKNDGDISAKIRSFIGSINNKGEFKNATKKDDTVFVKNGFELYKILLQPELKQTTRKKLIVNPDGILWYLPFETLLTQKEPITEHPNYKNLPYLLRTHAISYTPSASIKWISENSNKAKTKYIGFAPNYQDQKYHEDTLSLPNLFHNTEEIDYASQLFGGQKWLGTASTESQFKKSSDGAGIVHFAMHADVEDQHPLLSKLYLTPSKYEDGILHTYEIYNLSLSAQLVILSGCQTASGKFRRGEGIISLERAFQYAGSSSLLSTFWVVDDQSSSTLTRSFLTNLQQGDSKDIALQKAKIAFLDTATPDKLHPFYWSNFKITGNTQPLKKESNILYTMVILSVLIIVITMYRKIKRLKSI